MESIAVIGATGYVGQYLIDHLNALGITPYTITRTNGSFLLSSKKVHNYNIADDTLNTKKFDVVINLAYPTGDKQFRDKENNKALVDLIDKISTKDSKIIHTSTIAVFGFNLDHTVKAEKINYRHDWAYVESKIHFENILLERFKDREVHIVRFGNVWGPKSKNWTVPIMNNVFYQQPVAIKNEDGYCNCTEVRNAADYLYFLASNTFNKQSHFHHLAEFYNIKWSFWLNKFSTLFNTPVTYLTELYAANESKTIAKDLKKSFAQTSPKKLLKSIYKSKIAGSYFRSAVALLPGKVLTRLERENEASIKKTIPENTTFFSIMSCAVPFVNNTVKNWNPPISAEQSWIDIQNWMKEINFIF